MDEIPFALRLKLTGLKVDEAEVAKLAEQVARLDSAAKTIRLPRSYLDEPAVAIRRAVPAEPTRGGDPERREFSDLPCAPG